MSRSKFGRALRGSILFLLVGLNTAIAQLERTATQRAADAQNAPARFPTQRPDKGSFPRPRADEALEITPPGFCWWRADAPGTIRYRVKVTTESGRAAYESSLLDDPVDVPEHPLPAGRYSWIVEAVSQDGAVRDTWGPQRFSIAPNAVAQPWIDPAALLGRVPPEHPRLLFPKAQLASVRATLQTTRKAAYASLVREADRALTLTPLPEPTYDKLTDPAERRLVYQQTYRDWGPLYNRDVTALALMYLMTGERRYGEKAKVFLMNAVPWDPEGVSSVMGRYGDEVGLILAKSCAQYYDWLYDLLTEAERAQVKKMLLARADQMLRRLTRSDFLFKPEDSHLGRLPGYLIEHAIALAEEPRAQVWLRYAMQVELAVFPHWAGVDGGWAEGVDYGLGYNSNYISPFESLRVNTGMDLWQRTYYRQVRRFFIYNVSPLGEIIPFGDAEERGVPRRGPEIKALLQFHASRYSDPVARGWADLLRDASGQFAAVSFMPGLILADDVKPASPAALPPDAAFFGIGWATFHSDLAHPERDLMLMFKSSPYGPVSHGHADQNSFAIMQGGKTLATPAGAYYPTHGAPFHTEYSEQTIAHNGILVDGHGEINRDGSKGGRLTSFQSHPHVGYACGDAASCYGDRLTRFQRHVLFIRPSVIVIVDDLRAPQPAEFQWLLHGRETFAVDQPGQKLKSHRAGESMAVRLFTPGGFKMEQTSQWPLDPKQGFPSTTEKEPDLQWHFTATTQQKSAERRIAAVMLVDREGLPPDCRVSQSAPDRLEIELKSGEDRAQVKVNLDPKNPDRLLAARYEPAGAKAETVNVE